LELKTNLNFLRLNYAVFRVRVYGRIMKLFALLRESAFHELRWFNNISVLVPDVFSIKLYELGVIHYLAVEIEFYIIGHCEVKEVTRLKTTKRVHVEIAVWESLTFSFVKRRVSYVNITHLVGLCCTLIIIVALRTETRLSHSKFFSASKLIWVLLDKHFEGFLWDSNPFVLYNGTYFFLII